MTLLLLGAGIGAVSVGFLAVSIWMWRRFKLVGRDACVVDQDTFTGYQAFLAVRNGKANDIMCRRIHDRWNELTAERDEAEKRTRDVRRELDATVEEVARLRRQTACCEGQLAYARTVLTQYKRRVAELETVLLVQDRESKPHLEVLHAAHA